MIRHALLLSLLLLLGGCSTMGFDPNSIAVVTEEYGQCLANTGDAPKFGKKRVTFKCQNSRVLLGIVYEKEGDDYIDSAILLKKDGKYSIKDKKLVLFRRALHSVCQIKPMQGTGDERIKRYFFDISTKKCRPFIWHGDGGFVPFENLDACQQYCNYQYQG